MYIINLFVVGWGMFFFKYDVVNCFVYVIILFNLRFVKLLICNRVF